MDQNKKAYTIKLFMPDGDPSSLKVISNMNWTGIGLVFSRDSWNIHRDRREEFGGAGIYILIGDAGPEDGLTGDAEPETDGLPAVYVGQSECVKGRIDGHVEGKSKQYWDKALVFTSQVQLNGAQIKWLEWALIKKASEVKRCCLENKQKPSEPSLDDGDKSDMQRFLNEMLGMLPLVGVEIFNEAKKIRVKSEEPTLDQNADDTTEDTIVVSAHEEGFKEVFLGEDCWYPVAISSVRKKEIRYIAAYLIGESKGESKITHIADIDMIEEYGDGKKYKLNFKGKAKKIGPIGGSSGKGKMRNLRYFNRNRLLEAKDLKDLFG